MDNVIKILKRLITRYFDTNEISMSEFGRQTGISKAWLSQIINDDDINLSINIINKILKNIGYKLTIEKEGAYIYKSRLKKYALKR